MTRRLAAAAALLCLVGSPAAPGARAESLPRPPALDHQVRFWTRVYSEVDTQGGFVHDSRRLDVVYEVVRFPAGMSRRGREREVERIKDKYVAALRRLAAGKRANLTHSEAHVLALWPPGVSNQTLREAAGNVRFQLGQADKFREGLIRAGRYEPHIRQVFGQYGVPPEIAALPHVESSFNPHAYSSAGAAGLWQFTRGTGRRFLRVDYEVDDRFDPDRSTEAAARLLLENYRRTGAWPLAITAYNHGASGMARAIGRLGTRDIEVVVERYQSRSFGFASRNFYTELLAALDVERGAERYFGRLEVERPPDYEVIELDHYYRVSSLVDAFGIDAGQLREHNLALRLPVWRDQKYVPRGFALRIPRDPARPPAQTLLAQVPAHLRYAAQRRDTTYRVQRGDTLSGIARRFGVREAELAAANGLRSRHRIHVGQLLTLPGREAPAPAPVLVADLDDFDGTYGVRRGDTLAAIARRFGVSEHELAAANGLRDRNRIQVGQRLRVPGREGPPAAPAGSGALVVADASAAAADEAAAAEAPAPAEAPAAGEALAEGEGSPGAEAPDAGAPSAPAEQIAAAPAADGPAASEPLPDPEALVAPEEPAVAPPGPAPAPAEPAGEPESPPEAAPEVAARGPGSSWPQAAGPAAGAADAAPAAEPGPAQGELPPPVPAQLAAAADRYGVAADGSIRVEAGETLGHYADWLELPTARLRRLNGLDAREALVIGRRVRLDFSRVAPDDFAQRRLRYHVALQREFFASFRVAGTRMHVLRRGDTVWSLSRRHQTVPLWLLQHYNPGVDFSALRPGERIEIPRLERRPG